MYFDLEEANKKLFGMIKDVFGQSVANRSFLVTDDTSDKVTFDDSEDIFVLMLYSPMVTLYLRYSIKKATFTVVTIQVADNDDGFHAMARNMENTANQGFKYPIVLQYCDSLEDAKKKLGDKSFMAQLTLEARKVGDENRAKNKINRLLAIDPNKLSNYRLAKATGIAYSRIWKLRRDGLKDIDDMQLGTIKRFVKFYDEYFNK